MKKTPQPVLLYLLLGVCFIGAIVALTSHRYLALFVWVPGAVAAGYFLSKKLAIISKENEEESKLGGLLSRFYEIKLSEGGDEKIDGDVMKSELGLSDEEFKALDAKTRKSIIDKQLKEAIVDEKLAPEDYDNIMLTAQRLGVDLSFDNDTSAYLDRVLLYWQIENGELPIEEVSLALHRGEVCHFVTNAKWLERRLVPDETQVIEEGQVVEEEVLVEVLQEVDNGELFVTNMRLIFIGGLENMSIPVQTMLAVAPYPDGVQIELENGKGPILLSPDPALLFRVITRIIQQ